MESIAQITPEILYACTDAFYRPQNMVLAVAGNVTMDEVLAACARADIPVKTGTVERLASAEGPDVAEPYREFSMAVAKPLLGVALKKRRRGRRAQDGDSSATCSRSLSAAA